VGRASAVLGFSILIAWLGAAGAHAAPSGRAVSFDCRGVPHGRPTVVLESGAFGTSADWDRVQSDLAKAGRVCAYDRLGLGASPDRSDRPDAATIAADLAASLDAWGETAPVVLVGHSNGALYVETFAALFPGRTAGVAYVDGVGSDDLDSPVVMEQLQGEARMAQLAVRAGGLGLMRVVAGTLVDEIGLTGGAAERKRSAMISLRHVTASRDEVLRIIPDLAQARAAGPLPADLPVAVIAVDPARPDAVSSAWRAAKVAPARRACRGWVLDLVGATHVTPLGRDRAYVLAAVAWLQDEALSRPATACTADEAKS
jgi:pimeloyl-ACP methyl ester carboxylesterase